MFKEEIHRREAMCRIMKSVALAAGISVLDIEKLLAAERLSVSSSVQTKLKFLKVKLSGFDSRVFQSEFGRITPMKPAASMNIGGIRDGMGCPVHMVGGFSGADSASACAQFSVCGSNGAGSCPSLETCQENVCSEQGYGGGGGGSECTTNDCNGQNCELDVCGENECTDQDCELGGCGINRTNLTGLLEQLRNDPYVQGLMTHFNTTDTGRLANQVEGMLRQKRFMTPQQIMGVNRVEPKRSIQVRPNTR